MRWRVVLSTFIAVVGCILLIQPTYADAVQTQWGAGYVAGIPNQVSHSCHIEFRVPALSGTGRLAYWCGVEGPGSGPNIKIVQAGVISQLVNGSQENYFFYANDQGAIRGYTTRITTNTTISVDVSVNSAHIAEYSIKDSDGRTLDNERLYNVPGVFDYGMCIAEHPLYQVQNWASDIPQLSPMTIDNCDIDARPIGSYQTLIQYSLTGHAYAGPIENNKSFGINPQPEVVPQSKSVVCITFWC